MGEKKIEAPSPGEVIKWDTLPLMMTAAYFCGRVVTWSRKTLDRRIADEGFPTVKDGVKVLIPRDQARLWFKQRESRG